MIVNTEVFETARKLAPIVTLDSLVTALVVIVNVPLVWPAGTTTVAGTAAPAPLLESNTLIPPNPGGLVSVTVPVAVRPPPTGEGLRLSEESAVAWRASVALCWPSPNPAVIVAVVAALTPAVWIVKVTISVPGGAMTDAGTVTLASLEDSATDRPVHRGDVPSLSVPVADCPPRTEVGEIVSLSGH